MEIFMANTHDKVQRAKQLDDTIRTNKDEMFSQMEEARKEYRNWQEGFGQQMLEDQLDGMANDWAGNYDCAYPGSEGDDQPH
ncbi:MAG: hypothetical protein MI810_24175 [Flavobacteriales bacterium]|nr:hypothetical protein [Flavobacteriales bacterium]